MLEEIITLEEALSLEAQGKIIIYNPNTVTSILSATDIWRGNWLELRKNYRKIPLSKLPQFIDFEYRVEHKFMEGIDPVSTNWVYMYAKCAVGKAQLDEGNSRGRFVYILTNEAYPGFCKIGRSVTPSKRIKQINGAGTVSEWVLKYALPVSNDVAMENIVHQCLEHLKRSSHQGSKREFFEIGLEEAIENIERIGKYFLTSEPIYY